VERDRIIIEIADTGKGVPPDLLVRIFDPFFTTKRTGKGYGLGLSISLSLAESLGGGLSVESATGQGSKFRLWLPSGGTVAQPALSTQPFDKST
jgi:signal transduction histidine kinase